MVWQSCSADFLSSSSMSMILLVRAETSLSTSLNCFSASSRDFLAVVTDVAVSLVGPGGGLPGGLLEASDGVVETICLALQRLHLLPDGIHVGRFSFSSCEK